MSPTSGRPTSVQVSMSPLIGSSRGNITSSSSKNASERDGSAGGGGGSRSLRSSGRSGSGRDVVQKNHAETKARDLFAAGVGGPEQVVPIVHRGSSKRRIGYSKAHHDDYDEEDEDRDPATTVDTMDDEEAAVIGTAVSGHGHHHPTKGHFDSCNNSTDYSDDTIDDDDNVPERSLCHLFGINAFAFAYGLLISTFGLITLPVESERFWPKAHAVLLAIFLGICGISQLSGPVAGFFSDRCTSPMGRRRPFLLLSSLVSVPAIALMRWASWADHLPVYLFCFFLAMLSLNVMYVAYSGALTDLVNENQRGFANGLMGAFSVGGASIGFGCFSAFLTVETGYYFYIMVLATTVFISMISWTERPRFYDDDIAADDSSVAASVVGPSWTWKEIGESYWIDPVEHRDFFLVFVSRTLYYMGVSVQTFMLFYFRDVIDSDHPQADVAFLALFGQLSGAIFCVPMGLLSNRTGRKALIYLSTAIIIGTYCLFMFCRTRHMAFLGGAIYGIGNGTYLSVDYALACDTIPNKDNAARYLGIWGVGAFVGTLFGPMIIGPALLYFGSFSGRTDENGVPMYDVLGYMVILAIGNACLLAGAAVVAPIRSAK